VKAYLVAATLLILALPACDGGFERMAIADAPAPEPQADARTLMRYYGCGDCHTIPGVPGARGRVGPTLEKFGERAIIAGAYPNTPDNLTLFIVAPPALRPDSAMPVTGISEPQARTVAAYLLDPPRRTR
jgi:cytochrome c